MKALRCWTICMSALGILFLGTLPAWGQGENPPASTEESGATSGHGMTMVEQTYKHALQEQIENLHNQRWQAALRHDADFFERELANQYFGVGADGRLRTKAQTIAGFMTGDIKYEAVNERDVTVETYGDAGIVNSAAVIKAMIDGKPVSGDYHARSIYVRERGDWKEVAFELAP